MSHLQTFSKYKITSAYEYPKTYIRLPLRTANQAEHSKIANHQVTALEIRKHLYLFKEDIEQGGLLFLKAFKDLLSEKMMTSCSPSALRTPTAYYLGRSSISFHSCG